MVQPSGRQFTATLRETTKWVVTAAAGLGLVLVAGLGFGDVAKAGTSALGLILEIGGAAVALGAVAVVIGFAARVLAGRFNSYLAVLERNEAAEARGGGTLPGSVIDGLIKDIELNSDFLYEAQAPTLQALYQKLRDVDEELLETRSSLDEAMQQHMDALEIKRQALLRATQRVVDFADEWATIHAFNHLKKALWIAGGFVVIGVLAFSFGVNLPTNTDVLVTTTPVPVKIYFTEAGETWARVHLGCTPLELDGQAIGGTLGSPDVVTPASTGGCRAGHFSLPPAMGTAVPVRTLPWRH